MLATRAAAKWREVHDLVIDACRRRGGGEVSEVFPRVYVAMVEAGEPAASSMWFSADLDFQAREKRALRGKVTPR